MQIAHQIAMRQFTWVADIVRNTMIDELNQAAALKVKRSRDMITQRNEIARRTKAGVKRRARQSRGGTRP